jgi:hypothetical protein
LVRTILIEEEAVLSGKQMAKFRPLCWALGFSIFLAAMLVYRVKWRTNGTLVNTGFESVELGSSIALKGSFSDPFAVLPTGPSAHVAPGYPFLVALIVKVFGTGPDGAFAMAILTKAVVAAQLALFPFLAEYLGLRYWTGAIGGAAWLIAGFSALPWEGDFAGLLIVILAFPMYKAFRHDLSTTGVVSTGILWGLLLLFTPTPLLVLCAWLVCLRMVSKRSWREVSLLAVIPVLVVLPWFVRNYHVFHRPVFLRDNLGLEVAVSNNWCATFSFELNRACFRNDHPNENYWEALRVRTLGEPAYNQVRLHEALKWINSHRRRFLLLTARRFVAFWFPNTSGNPLREGWPLRTEWVTYVFTLMSILGLLLLWRKDRYATILLGLWLTLFPLTYYVIQFSPRYRHPILWATLLPGSYLIVELLSIGRRGRTIHRSIHPA